MNKESYNVAVAGATGVVGREIIRILEHRGFPVGELKPLASERSAGISIEFRGEEVPVGLLSEESFEHVDIGLFSPGGSVSAKYAPVATRAGCVVIDNTSHFRLDPDVPLVVPEVNPEDIAGFSKKNIVANPNCSTIQMVVVLKPIHDRFGIKRVVVSTYQSVSGAGRDAMEELSDQVRSIFNLKGVVEKKIFPHQIAFNCLPHIDAFLPDGYTKEEMKMVHETRKIMGLEDLRITATAVRVPVFVAHSESINIETEREVTPKGVREALEAAPGVKVVDDPQNCVYPTALEAAETDDVFVGRIRVDESVANGVNIWVVADNIRKGAALNAVQIAEVLIKEHL